MKVVLRKENKNYNLEVKKISGAVKSKVRELDKKKQELQWQTLKDIDKVGISNIGFAEMLVLKNYQALYPNQVMPDEAMKEVKPIYEKISEEIEALHYNWYLIEMCKILLEEPKDLDDFNSNYDSEFWQNQDEEEMMKVLDFFRRRRS